jgi:hypothetical protein
MHGKDNSCWETGIRAQVSGVRQAATLNPETWHLNPILFYR